MSTEDIYLPPLPDLPAYSPEVFDREVKVVSETMTEQLMQAYARAAIEADRKRRGEPVAWMAEHQSGEWHVRGTPTIPSTGIYTGRIKPLYEAPQPAEPVAAYKMVPVEPTPQMIAAFRSGFQNELHKNDRRRTMSAEEAGLRAMLKATPQPAEPVRVPSDSEGEL